MKIIKDEFVGEVYYQGGWRKEIPISFWSVVVELTVLFSAYEDESINNEQQQAYLYATKKLSDIAQKSEPLMKDFVKKQWASIKAYTRFDEMPERISDIVHPNMLMIQDDGRMAILCDLDWDDHGIAVLFDTSGGISVDLPDMIW